MIACSSDAYHLWTAMWSRADEVGVFRGDPHRLARAVVGRASARDVAALLAELERSQLVEPCPRQRWRGVQLRRVSDGNSHMEND